MPVGDPAISPSTVTKMPANDVGRDVKPPRLLLLDLLRFLAALAVMTFHYFFNGLANGKVTSDLDAAWVAGFAAYGYLGVDVFFLISGFVILTSARGKSARQFVVGRATRLFPAFWLAMLITAFGTALWGSVSGLSVGVGQIAVNMTMVPAAFGVSPVDGVYWTLLYEIQFYVVIFLVLAAGQGHRLSALLPAWAFAVLGFALVAPASTAPIFGGYFALFVTGALIADILHSGWTPWRSAGVVASALALARTVPARTTELAHERGIDYSLVVPCVVILTAIGILFAMGWRPVAGVHVPLAATLGALTYPLYLVHAHLGYIALSNFGSRANQQWVWALTIAGAIALAAVVHIVAERLPKRFWFRFFDRVAGDLNSLGRRLARTVRPSRPRITKPLADRV